MLRFAGVFVLIAIIAHFLNLVAFSEVAIGIAAVLFLGFICLGLLSFLFDRAMYY